MKSVSVTAAAWQTVAASERGLLEDVVSQAEEADWITRSKAGDLEAFQKVYQRYESGVFRHAYRLLENADEADDVRQETFVRAYQSINRFRGDARLRTYLFAICGNICRDRLRHHYRHPENGYGLSIPEGAVHLSQQPSSLQEDPFNSLKRAADAALVRRALHRLPPADREVLLLRYAESMELDEVAATIGCTRVSVPVRLFRARRRFKDIFQSLLKEEGE